MPSAYILDESRSLLLSRAWGVFTDQDLLTHHTAFTRDPRFRPGFNQLADLRDVTSLAVTSAGVRQQVRETPFGAGSRRALVVGSDVAFGMARMFQILQDESVADVEIFRELDDALAWLGLTDAKAAVLTALASAPTIAEGS